MLWFPLKHVDKAIERSCASHGQVVLDSSAKALSEMAHGQAHIIVTGGGYDIGKRKVILKIRNVFSKQPCSQPINNFILPSLVRFLLSPLLALKAAFERSRKNGVRNLRSHQAIMSADGAPDDRAKRSGAVVVLFEQ